MKLIMKAGPIFIATSLFFSGCEMMAPVASTAIDTENILEETERHNKVMEKETKRHNQIIEEEEKKQTLILEEISKTLKVNN